MELRPSLFCLLFCLLYFFLPPFEELDCFSGCLMSTAGIQKLFCGIYSTFKCSFDEFVGEKVVSPSYSSAILAPPPPLSLNWKVSLAMAVRDEPSRTAQQFCSVLKCHPDQSTLWEFLFSGPKCLLPHSSAPKQGRLIPPKFCSFLQQSSFFPHNIHQVPKV